MDGGPQLRYLLTTTLMLAGGCDAQPEAGIDSLPESERESFFLEAIRESGFICAGVMTMQPISDDGTAWRVSCTDPAAYLVTVSGRTVTEVSPTPYAEPLRGAPTPRPPSPRPRLD